jgi:hypothetical protein
VVLLKIYEQDLARVKRDFRTLYVVDVEHGYRLDCDIDAVVYGLKSVLRKERETNRRLMATGGMPDGVAALAAIGGTSRAAQTGRRRM